MLNKARQSGVLFLCPEKGIRNGLGIERTGAERKIICL